MSGNILERAVPWGIHKQSGVVYHFGLRDGSVVPTTCPDPTCWCGGHEAAEWAKRSAPRPWKVSY